MTRIDLSQLKAIERPSLASTVRDLVARFEEQEFTVAQLRAVIASFDEPDLVRLRSREGWEANVRSALRDMGRKGQIEVVQGDKQKGRAYRSKL